MCACVADPELGETSFAVTNLVLEAEDSTGAGYVEADTAASNDAVLVLTTPGTFAEQSFQTNNSIVGGSVYVRGDSCNPVMRVVIDGVNVAYAQTSTTWTTVDFVGPYTGNGNHTLALHYRSGIPGCTLRFDHVTLTIDDPPPPPPPPPPAVVVEAEDANGDGSIVADAAASGGAYRLFSAAYQDASAVFATTDATTGTVYVRSSNCKSMPYAKVTIDGIVATMTPVSTSGSWVALPLGQWGSGNHSIIFENRYSHPGCALHFDHATFTQ